MIVERILVFVPQAGDETIACGGYLSLKQQNRAAIKIIVVGDELGGLSRHLKKQAELRREELLQSLNKLQIKDVQFWQFNDQAIPLSGEILDAYDSAVQGFYPDRILLPAPGEADAGYRRLTRGLLKALSGRWQGELWFYECRQPAPLVNTVIDIGNVLEQKLAALACYASRLKQFDYLQYCRSLAQMRGLSSAKQAGEAFLVYQWDGDEQNFFESRPLISVIVRSQDAQILRQALNSLCKQTYDQLEVILVWFGDQPPNLDDFNVLDIQWIPGKQNRSYNLNLGIAEAKGEFIAILDDDDVVYPEHYALLLAEIQSDPKIDAAHSYCRVVACRRQEERVQLDRTLEIFDSAIESERLLLGNIAPINALLFRAQTFHTFQFDESFQAYEDWALMASLALAGYRFACTEEVSCEYRIYSDAEQTSIADAHAEKGYLAWRQVIQQFIAEQMEASHLEQLSALVQRLDQRESTIGVQLKQAHQQIQRQQKKLEQQQALQDLLNCALPAFGVDAKGRRGMAEMLAGQLSRQTLFSVVMPVYNTDADILLAAIESVIKQSYAGWQLCLVDDGSTRAETIAILEDVQTRLQATGKLRYLRRSRQGGIVQASNDALTVATAPYLAFVDHDDLLGEDALLELALALTRQPECRLLYTDSYKIDHAGSVLHEYHKPDWSPETLTHLNYINHLTVADRQLVVDCLGGLNAQSEGAQDWDLLLRAAQFIDASEVCHLRKPLYSWRATEQSLAYQSAAKPEAFNAGMQSVKQHLQRMGRVDVDCQSNPLGPGVVTSWQSELRTIEIIIPTHNNLPGLKLCLEGLREDTDYSFAQITVVANRCEDAAMLAYLESLSTEQNIVVATDNRIFNWAAINNSIALKSRADLLLFMNDDVEIRQQDWLRQMQQYIDLAGIAVVGANLYYPDGELQHNGVRTDCRWVADNIQNTGMLGELSTPRNVAAVTGACMLVDRRVFVELGGFDEQFAVNYNDIDYCLAVRKAGYRILQATDVALTNSVRHDYSVSKITDLTSWVKG